MLSYVGTCSANKGVVIEKRHWHAGTLTRFGMLSHFGTEEWFVALGSKYYEDLARRVKDCHQQEFLHARMQCNVKEMDLVREE